MTMSVYCECLSVSSKRQSTLPLFNEKHLCAQTHSTAQEPDLRGKPRGVQASCTQSALAARGEVLNVKGKITPSSRRLECDYLQFWKRTPGGLRLIWPRHWVQGPCLKKKTVSTVVGCRVYHATSLQQRFNLQFYSAIFELLTPRADFPNQNMSLLDSQRGIILE